ncbi:hypothetical protein [Mycobacterium novum]
MVDDTATRYEKLGASPPESGEGEAGQPQFEGDPESTPAGDDRGAEAEEAAAAVANWISPVRLALACGLFVIVALTGLGSWIGYEAYRYYQADKQRALFIEVARQGAINLTTIDYERAAADVQRVLDSATDEFYEDFSRRSQPFIEIVKQAKSKSEGKVTEAGLESESEKGAQVLVTVTVYTSNAGASEQSPRLWRMRVAVKQVGPGEVKVSNVGFVP